MEWVVAAPEISASLPQAVPVQEVAFSKTLGGTLPNTEQFLIFGQEGV